MRNVFRKLFSGVDEDRHAPHDQTAPDPSATDDAEFGPLVRLADDFFEIRGRRFPRRRLPEASANGNVSDAARGWRLSHDEIRGSLPEKGEIFLHITPSMADVLERIADIADNDRVANFLLLTGPTGCGKTTIAKTYCYMANEPFTELNFSGDTTLADFFRRTEVELRDDLQTTVSALGPATEAMLLGKKLIINEINMLPPDLLSVITQAMDTGRILLSGSDAGNVEIELHEDFGIIATANPNYVGTMEIGRALERRFGLGLGNVPMTFLPPDEEAEALKFEFDRQELFRNLGLTANPTICQRLVALADGLRNHDEIGGQMRDRVSTRTLVHWLSLARTTGLPLADVGQRAVLTIAPPELQNQTFQMTRASLGSAGASTAYDDAFRRAILGPDLPDSGEAVAVPEPTELSTTAQTNGSRIDSEGEDYALSGGGSVRIYWSEDGPPDYVATGADGREIEDPEEVIDVRRRLRSEHGLNFPTALGSVPSLAAALPCLTRSTWTAIRLAQGALLGGYPVFLKGPTGCGKSAMARTVARLWGRGPWSSRLPAKRPRGI